MSRRIQVERFADAMERELRCNDNAKGDRGWIDCDMSYLLERLQEEVDELRLAVEHAKTYRDEKSVILAEASDVANFCMMIADRIGALDAPPPDSAGRGASFEVAAQAATRPSSDPRTDTK